MPISGTSKWYPRKQPTLQIKILKEIATNGQLSKKMARDLTGSHYPDVSDAIEKLLKNKLILVSKSRPILRDKRFFKLSKTGLESFIDMNPGPEEFWEALSQFCNLSGKRIEWDKFDTLYLRFQSGNLGYIPRHGYFFQFKFIDKLFKKWLKDNEMLIHVPFSEQNSRRPGFVLCQRMLECLGMNRSVTFDQLIQQIEEQRPIFEQVFRDHFVKGKDRTVRKEEIERVLDQYTLSSNYPKAYHSRSQDGSYEYDQKINDYVDFLQHLVIICRHEEDGSTRYELSLYGIALLLTTIVYYQLNREFLFYNNIEFEEYCMRVAQNYQDKLPLVFGKWQSLMRETVGDNRGAFDILRDLFNDRTSNAMIESSVILGGVKEYYDSVKALSAWAYPRLEKIHEAGKKVLRELGQANDSDCKIEEIFSRKIEEIFMSIRQRNLNKFMDGLQVGNEPDSPIKDPCSIYANELVYMEKALADETSFLFYIFLYVRDLIRRDFEPNYSTYFPASSVPGYSKRIEHLKNGVRLFEYKRERVTGNFYPLQSSVNIIRNHEDVQQLLVNWIDDAAKCQDDAQLKISDLKAILEKQTDHGSHNGLRS